jgi:hypothetical protein
MHKERKQIRIKMIKTLELYNREIYIYEARTTIGVRVYKSVNKQYR